MNEFELLQSAIKAAVMAGRHVMDVYQRPFTTTKKDDDSPLTEADIRSNREIMRILEGETPEIPVLSEEGTHLPGRVRRGWSTLWMVDPLDGTKEFIKRTEEFTVNVALMGRVDSADTERTENPDGMAHPLLGVVYLPALQMLYAGVATIGAWRMSHDPYSPPPTVATLRRDGTPLPDPMALANRPWTVVVSRSHMSPATEQFVQDRRREFPELDMVSSGSSLKICRVAEGRADEYPRFAPTMEWDTAAGDAVARGAGCEVLRWDAGPAGALMYNKDDLHNPWFLVRRTRLWKGIQ